MSNKIILDVRISSYTEPKVRIIALFDKQNQDLTISKILPYELPKDPYANKTTEQLKKMRENERHTLRVVDNISIPKWDLHFKESEYLQQAISAYFELNRSNSLILGKEISGRYSIESVLQVRKIDVDKGNVYELNQEETECGHVAILAACWASLRVQYSSTLIEEHADPTPEQIDDFLVPFTI